MTSLPTTHSVANAAGWSLTLQVEPFALTLARPDGAVVWQAVGLGWRDAAGTWHVADRGAIGETGAVALAATVWHAAGTGGVALRAWAEGEDFRLALAVQDADPAAPLWLRLDWAAGPDEHFLGFGERFDSLDQRGKTVDLHVTNGASGGLTYKPIPFFMSSCGYGVQILTSVRSIIRLATPDDPATVSLRVAAPTLGLRLIPGESLKAILTRYTAHAGRQPLPPDWVFGPWKGRDWSAEDQSLALEDLEQTRALGLAGTVKLIDASWEPYLHSFTFDERRWPAAQALLERARALGFRVVLWVAPWLVHSDPPSENYRLCAERGYFIHRPDGAVYVHRLANSPTFVGSCLDFTNPDALAWWQAQIRRLAGMGIAGFKTDFGEQIPEDAVFHDGRTGRELHNLYPVLYNRATWEALQGKTHGFLLARSAWDGSQGICGIWAGDQSSDFGPATGLRSALVAGQSAGLSGFPFWTCDIGGYFGTPTDEAFVRWAQFGAFGPIMQIHGLGKREPWAFAPETLAIYRYYARLHMDLLPYTLAHARQAAETGLPILRALALEFPADPGAWGDLAEHEYLFGEMLLVAPVYYGHDAVRFTYLPAGGWRDFWSGAPLAGGQTHRLPAPLDRIPVAARMGAVIPLLDPSPDTCLPASDPAVRSAGPDLRAWIYAGADGGITLADDTRLAWDDAGRMLTITGSPVARRVAARLVGVNAAAAASGSNGQALPLDLTSLNGEPGYAAVYVAGPSPVRITFDER